MKHDAGSLVQIRLSPVSPCTSWPVQGRLLGVEAGQCPRGFALGHRQVQTDSSFCFQLLPETFSSAALHPPAGSRGVLLSACNRSEHAGMYMLEPHSLYSCFVGSKLTIAAQLEDILRALSSKSRVKRNEMRCEATAQESRQLGKVIMASGGGPDWTPCLIPTFPTAFSEHGVLR